MTLAAFITTIEADASAVEQDVVAGLKAAAVYVDNVIVNDIEPALATAFQTALSTFGADMLQEILALLKPGATVVVPTPAPSA